MSTTPSRKEQTHERIVAAAARAIRRAGYEGVGVADVMKEAGLTHGGFYAHFESRDAMLVEAMQHAGRESAATLAEHVAAREAAGESRFRALVEAYLADEMLDDVEGGCIVAAVCSEMPRLQDELRDAARRRVLAVIGGVRGALPEGTDSSRAEMIAATLVGTMQLARTLGGAPGKAMLKRTREALLTEYESGRTG